MTPAVSSDDFRAAMRGFMGHVSLVTVAESGLVVTSATSLSAEPPMILFCINRNSSTWPALQSQRRFGWSALGAAHQSVAERFSGRTGVTGADRFAGADWFDLAGVRLLVGAPLAFACEVKDMIDKGTHSIVIGQVQGITTQAGAGVLAYNQGAYLSL